MEVEIIRGPVAPLGLAAGVGRLRAISTRRHQTSQSRGQRLLSAYHFLKRGRRTFAKAFIVFIIHARFSSLNFNIRVVYLDRPLIVGLDLGIFGQFV